MTSLLVLMLAMAAAPTPAEAAPTAKQAPAVPAVDTAPPQAPPVAVPQAVDSDSSSPSPEPAQPASPESELMTARRSDAAIDQAWLSPTALTQPRGSVTLETHDLVLLTSTIGVFDRLQLTFRVVPGFIAGDWLPSGGFKAHVMSTDHFHASVFANATGLGGDFVLTLGAVVTFCTSASCGGAFSVYGSVDPVNHKAISDNPNHWDTAYLYGASAVGALGRRTKLVAELNLVGHKGERDDLAASARAASAGMLGVRFVGGHVSVTVGALVVAREGISSHPNQANGPWVLPALSLVGRFDLPSQASRPQGSPPVTSP